MSHEVDPKDDQAKRSLAQKLKQAAKAAREKAITSYQPFHGFHRCPEAV